MVKKTKQNKPGVSLASGMANLVLLLLVAVSFTSRLSDPWCGIRYSYVSGFLAIEWAGFWPLSSHFN